MVSTTGPPHRLLFLIEPLVGPIIGQLHVGARVPVAVLDLPQRQLLRPLPHLLRAARRRGVVTAGVPLLGGQRQPRFAGAHLQPDAGVDATGGVRSQDFAGA